MIKVLKYGLYDLSRSRWTYAYAVFYLLLTAGLILLSSDMDQVLISLMNVMLVLVPLIATLFGITYYYHAREFIELLLAQPLRRRTVFLGLYFALALSMIGSFVLGAGLPLLLRGILGGPQAATFLTLMGSGIVLSLIFTGLAFLIALGHENRIRGFGIAMLVWLFFAVIYDGMLLLALATFSDYPLEQFALTASMFNPIDLSRILMLLKMDISAMMGYTGAVFQSFFGTPKGMLVSSGVLVLWVVVPLLWMLRRAGRKDF